MITEGSFSQYVTDEVSNIAVAVSGGADSLCLCLLMHAHARSRGLKMVALTVDHQLRPESGAEASQVHEWLKARGIEHHILHWEKAETPVNLQDSARKARYDLLVNWCAQKHIPFLAVGHTREDQFETIMQRLAHHSGAYGLAGIPEKRTIGSVTIIRPLLTFSKAEIIVTLESLNQPWIEDPSNQKDIFTRIKIRQQMPRWAEHGLTMERVLGFQKKLSLWRQGLEKDTHIFCRNHVRFFETGYVSIAVQNLPENIKELVLVSLLKHVSGKIYPPRQDSFQRLLLALEQKKTSTCHGCLIIWKKDHVLIIREAQNIGRPAYFNHMKIARWDNRFQITLTGAQAGNDLRIDAIGNKWLDFTNNATLMSLPAAVRPTLPGVWRKERLLMVPHLDYYDALDMNVECTLLHDSNLKFG